jgi:hypothetical protein
VGERNRCEEENGDDQVGKRKRATTWARGIGARRKTATTTSARGKGVSGNPGNGTRVGMRREARGYVFC